MLLNRTAIKSNRCLLILCYLALEGLCKFSVRCLMCVNLVFTVQSFSTSLQLCKLRSQRLRVFTGARDSTEKPWQIDLKNVCLHVCLSFIGKSNI